MTASAARRSRRPSCKLPSLTIAPLPFRCDAADPLRPLQHHRDGCRNPHRRQAPRGPPVSTRARPIVACGHRGHAAARGHRGGSVIAQLYRCRGGTRYAVPLLYRTSSISVASTTFGCITLAPYRLGPNIWPTVCNTRRPHTSFVFASNGK